jgi:chromate transporter
MFMNKSMSSYSNPGDKTSPPADLFFSFFRLGLTAFGGPAMVAYIADLSVKRKKWLDQETFKKGLVLCQSIPGATAMQAVAYVGLRTGGLLGALLAYIGFGLPAFLFMLILSSIYLYSHNLSWMTSLFAGLQVIVVAIVAMATYNFGKTSLKKSTDVFLAAAAAIAFGLKVSPFFIIFGAALAGIGLFREVTSTDNVSTQGKPGQSIKYAVVLISAVLVGMTVLYLFNTELFKLALLMLKIDLFAFGGGFSSLPLMLQEVVTVHGWMDSKTFMDGIALGQITPGPIVITAAFVGMLTKGILGALVATAAIFTPSFIMLVVTAPFLDKLNQSKIFTHASRGILASFVGLLLFVTIRFAVATPWDLIRIIIALASLAALFKKIDILYIVIIGALAAVVLL